MQDQTEAVQRMQDYIDTHLCETITAADLARASYFSPWYAQRLFAQYTGHTPADYIRRLRLAKSALRLRDDPCKVTDVAFELGFGSIDGYQRAFLREFGCNPREYASHPIPLYLFTPYGVQYQPHEGEEMTMENVKTVFVQTIEKPKRKVLIKRGRKATEYFEYCEEVGCDVWGLLKSIKSPEGEPVCLWLPQAYVKPNTSVYVQGVVFEGELAIPDGFDVIELPACKYLMFQGEPFAEEDFEQAITQVWDAARKYDPTLHGLRWDTDTPRIQLEPIGSRGYIELWPVKE